jgi:hypothetical protein
MTVPTVACHRWPLPAGVAALALLLLVAVPLFVCMPLWSDVIHYDVCARNVLHGGIHYRDVGDLNLPGMVWVHMGLRTLLGWRSEPLRIVDLLVVAAIVWLLARWLRFLGLSPAARVWAAVLLFVFYFSTTEWAHCQRDTWMLLPALVALELRRRQTERLLTGEASLPGVAGCALAEGLVWGAAFWIKPFVAAPGFLCWLLSAWWVCRSGVPHRVRLVLTDAAGLLLGGAAAGAAGIFWLWRTGTWPYFLDTFLHVNRDYYVLAQNTGPLGRTLEMLKLLSPWGLVYLVAVPAAVLVLVRAVRRPPLPAGLVPHALLAAFFAGWFFQAGYVQMRHEYVLVPPLLLALTVAVAQTWPPRLASLRLLVVLAVVAVALPRHPLLRPNRLAVWARCWTEGGSPELKNRLTLTDFVYTPDWVALERVADFLRRQRVHDREVVCFNASSTQLYIDLNVSPATSCQHFDWMMQFPHHVAPTLRALNASPQRFVVSDLYCLKYPHGVLRGSEEAPSPGQSLPLPANFPEDWTKVYPWCEPVVFRSGRYQVHRVTGPVRELVSSLTSFAEPQAEGK